MVQVYVAQFPFPVEEEKVLPHDRAAEIDRCSNDDVRIAKFYVWKLLENALTCAFGLKIGELDLKCAKNGKWECPECCFSLSHSGNFAAVAVSQNPVGIDIERCNKERFTPALAKRIVTAYEGEMIESLEEAARRTELNALWTKKEAIFKFVGGDGFHPKHIETSKYFCVTKRFRCKDESYYITVASKDSQQIVFHKTDEFEFIDFQTVSSNLI